MAASELIVLLAQVVGGPLPTGETLAAIRRDFQRFVIEQAAQLTDPGQDRTVASGAFAGSRILGLYRGPSLIAQSFVFTSGNGSGSVTVLGQAHLLVERDTCYLRSSTLVGAGFPLAAWQFDLAKWNVTLTRPLAFPAAPLVPMLSPLRVKVLGHGPKTEVARILHEAAVVNLPVLSELGPVRSEVLARSCAHFGNKQSSGLRVHRDLVIDYVPSASDPTKQDGTGPRESVPEPERQSFSLPNSLPMCRLLSAPFAHNFDASYQTEGPAGSSGNGSADQPRETVNSADAAAPNWGVTPWSPVACLDWLATRAASTFTPLAPESFVVKKRDGRWVELDPGRISGLQVGKRLLGADGAQLHVIRQIAVKGAPDRVVAFIRRELPNQPVSVGDALRLDPTVYPAQQSLGVGL
jgi:hypothetical protein